MRLTGFPVASWSWSFSRKDLGIYGKAGEVLTVGTKKIQTRHNGDKEATESTAPALPTDRDSSLDYLTAVLHHTIKDQGLFGSSDTNVTVVHILDAARESVRTGKTILVKPLP